VGTPGLQDLLHNLPLGQGHKAQALKRVGGNAGNALAARAYALDYFIVIVN
jgi:hypothetical protein